MKKKTSFTEEYHFLQHNTHGFNIPCEWTTTVC